METSRPYKQNIELLQQEVVVIKTRNNGNYGNFIYKNDFIFWTLKEVVEKYSEVGYWSQRGKGWRSPLKNTMEDPIIFIDNPLYLRDEEDAYIIILYRSFIELYDVKELNSVLTDFHVDYCKKYYRDYVIDKVL